MISLVQVHESGIGLWRTLSGLHAMSASGAEADILGGVSLGAPSKCCHFSTTGKTLRLFINGARSPAPRAKINLFPKYGNSPMFCPVPRSLRRAFRDRHDTWRGMRWTRWAARRAAERVRSSRVVLSPRRWGQVCGRSASDGG